MIHIALCDDDGPFLQRLHQAIAQWFADHQIPFSCTDFSAANQLLDSLQSVSFNLFSWTLKCRKWMGCSWQNKFGRFPLIL